MPFQAVDSPSNPSKKRATISRLIKEARLAFAEKGLAGARVDDIARAAGVTKQLVYHYFQSKEELFAGVLQQSAQDVIAELLALELDHLPPTQALQAFLEVVIDQYIADPHLAALAQEGVRFHENNQTHRNHFSDRVPALAAQIDRILQRGMASGEFQPGMNTRMVYAAAVLLVTGVFINRYTTSALADVDSAAPEGVAAWRKFSVDFVLSAVLTANRPPALGA